MPESVVTWLVHRVQVLEIVNFDLIDRDGKSWSNPSLAGGTVCPTRTIRVTDEAYAGDPSAGAPRERVRRLELARSSGLNLETMSGRCDELPSRCPWTGLQLVHPFDPSNGTYGEEPTTKLGFKDIDAPVHVRKGLGQALMMSLQPRSWSDDVKEWKVESADLRDVVHPCGQLDVSSSYVTWGELTGRVWDTNDWMSLELSQIEAIANTLGDHALVQGVIRGEGSCRREGTASYGGGSAEAILVQLDMAVEHRVVEANGGFDEDFILIAPFVALTMDDVDVKYALEGAGKLVWSRDEKRAVGFSSRLATQIRVEGKVRIYPLGYESGATMRMTLAGQTHLSISSRRE